MNRITSISIFSLFAAFAFAGAIFLYAPSADAAAGGCCSGYSGSYGHNDNGSGYKPTPKLPPPPPPPPAPTCDMWVAPSTIEKGDSATLSWSSTNVTSVSINQGIGSVGTSGSLGVSPQQNTTYTGTFSGNGKTVTCSKTITVIEHPKAPSCALYASPMTINKGEHATLEWTSANTNSANFNQGIGSVAVNGSRTVSPQQTTTYTGTFTGQGGTVTCSKTITVITQHKPGPTCDMWATPTTIKKGDDAELSWNSTNAQSASINQGIGSVNVDDNITVSPSKTTTYTGIFYGYNGEQVTCNATVKVKDEPVHEDDLWCKLSVSDKTIREGDKVTLSWESEDADYGSINQGIGRVDEEGSKKVYPKKTTTYTGTFYNNDNDRVTCKVTVKVEDKYIPLPPQTPYVTLSSVPYTGLDLGPVGTAVYWSFLMLWCVLAAYLVAVKRIHVSIYRFLFGESQEGNEPQTPVQDEPAQPMAVLASMDPFLASQLNRKTS